MSIRIISTSKNLTISTPSNMVCLIEICTYLGTTVFKDNITPINDVIKIKGLNPGKYIIHISNKEKSIKRQINI